MPAYDGYSSVADYVSRRLQDNHLNPYQLSMRLKKSRNYIHLIVHDERLPSPKMCALIAQELGDEPQTLRILAGYETPPPAAADVALARKIQALSDADRAVVTRIVEALGKGAKTKTGPMGPVKPATRARRR